MKLRCMAVILACKVQSQPIALLLGPYESVEHIPQRTGLTKHILWPGMWSSDWTAALKNAQNEV